MSNTAPQYVDPPGTGGPPQWTRADLDRAHAEGRFELIDAATRAGQLRDVLTAPAPAPTDPSAAPGWRESHPGQLTRADLVGMSPEAIDAATREGRCDAILGRQPRQINT